MEDIGGVRVDIKIEIKIKSPNIVNLCPYCLGSGKLKAMQMAAVYGGGSIRVNDTKVKCNHCNGTGRRYNE